MSENYDLSFEALSKSLASRIADQIKSHRHSPQKGQEVRDNVAGIFATMAGRLLTVEQCAELVKDYNNQIRTMGLGDDFLVADPEEYCQQHL